MIEATYAWAYSGAGRLAYTWAELARFPDYYKGRYSWMPWAR